jgi:hypothetical protein
MIPDPMRTTLSHAMILRGISIVNLMLITGNRPLGNHEWSLNDNRTR